MRKYIVFNLIFCACLLASCSEYRLEPDGKTVSEDRAVPANFTGICASSGVYVNITDADLNGITVESDSNVLPYVETYVQDGVLYIETGNMKFSKKPVINVYVSFVSINSISAYDGSFIEMESLLDISDSDFSIRLEDGSRLDVIYGSINCRNLEAVLDGGSSLSILGDCSSYSVSARDGSSATGFNMVCSTLDAEVTDGSILNVSCTGTFDLVATNRSKVEIKGGGTPSSMDISGAADVKFGKR